MVRAILHVEPMEMKIETFTGRIHSAGFLTDAQNYLQIPFFFFFSNIHIRVSKRY